MKPFVQVDRCPHCGGASGFQHNIQFKAIRASRWDGSDVDTDNFEVLKETDPRCIDCETPVRSLFRAQRAQAQEGAKP